MNAQIIQFGGGKSAASKIAARRTRAARATTVTREPEPEPEAKPEPISFSFEGEDYQLIFRWGGDWRLCRLYYRIQNGRRVGCKYTVKYPSPELLSTAERHQAGGVATPSIKSEEATQTPEADTPSTLEPNAKTVDLITRVDAFRKIMTYVSQQLKAGRMPHDVMEAFGILVGPEELARS